MNPNSLLLLGLLALTDPLPAEDQNPGHLRIALVNMKSLYSADDEANIQKNLDRHLDFIDKAVAEGAEFVGFPEMSLSGYKCSKTMPFLKLDGPEVQALSKKAAEHRVYISAGMAEIDESGLCWDTQFVLDPEGKLLGHHHKIWMTDEKVFQAQPGSEHTIIKVKGTKMGLFICADGSDYLNIKALAEKGAKIVYGPHANTTGSTINGWYNFRKRFAGQFDGQMIEAPTSNEAGKAQVPASGWCDQLNITAAMHNHAALYNPEFNPPEGPEPTVKAWASGAWFIGPDGSTLEQIPGSAERKDCIESILLCNIPLEP